MDSERSLPDMTVLIGGGRVLAVRPSAEADEADIPAGATRVDGRGRFLIPGLNDMHVHFQDSSALGRFVATGVTGIRVLWGGLTDPGLPRPHRARRARRARHPHGGHDHRGACRPRRWPP